MLHSCADIVQFEFNIETEMGEVTARCDIPPKTWTGIWMLEDVDVWWKGADVRSQALKAEGLLGRDCVCQRCQGLDTCRAIKCPLCQVGGASRNGRTGQWICDKCDFSGSDDSCAGMIKIEHELREKLVQVTALSRQDLLTWMETLDSRLGTRHWLAMTLWSELFRREMAEKEASEQNFTAAWCS